MSGRALSLSPAPRQSLPFAGDRLEDRPGSVSQDGDLFITPWVVSRQVVREITCTDSLELLRALAMIPRLLSRRLAWLLVLAIAVFTLAPIELRPVTAAPANWERFAAFMVMGFLFCLGYPRHRWRIVGLVIALAGLLEVLQHVSPSRHGRLPDGFVKAAGALLGIGLAVTAERTLEWLRASSRPRRVPGTISPGPECEPLARVRVRNRLATGDR
jgi:hypothetical protein